jgi:hypothetical protein
MILAIPINMGIGALASGLLSDKFGRKRLLIAAAALLAMRGIHLAQVSPTGCSSMMSKNRKRGGTTTRFARDTETPRMQMWRLFRPRKYRGQNKRHGFLKEYIEGEERFCVL